VRLLFRGLLALDAQLTGRLTLPPDSRWQVVAAGVAHLGDGPLWFGVSLLLLALGDVPLRGLVLRVGAAVLLAVGLVTVVKPLVGRTRPQQRAGFYSLRYDYHSFPSGHAARVGAIAVTLALHTPLWAGPLLGAALAVALCRVALGIHWLSDALVGLLLGGLAAVAVVVCTV